MSKKESGGTSKPQRTAAKKVVLLSGDNPQIAKGYGDAPVREYIAAIPDWRGKTAARHSSPCRPIRAKRLRRATYT